VKPDQSYPAARDPSHPVGRCDVVGCDRAYETTLATSTEPRGRPLDAAETTIQTAGSDDATV